MGRIEKLLREVLAHVRRLSNPLGYEPGYVGRNVEANSQEEREAWKNLKRVKELSRQARERGVQKDE